MHYSNFTDISQLTFFYSWKVLLGVTVLYFCVFALATIKWKTFLPEYSFITLLRFTIIGQFYSIVLPGQLLGEVAKAYRFSEGKLEKARISSSVVVDKITGLTGLLIVAVVGVIFTRTAVLGDWQIGISIGLVGTLVLIFSLRFKVICSFATRYSPFSKILSPIITSYHEYAKDTSLIARAVLLGILLQLFTIWITFTFANALNITIAPFDWFWIFGLISILVLMPLTIGGLGLREGAFISLLGFFAVEPLLALQLSLSIFACQVVVGIFGAILEGYDWVTSLLRVKIQNEKGDT